MCCFVFSNKQVWEQKISLTLVLMLYFQPVSKSVIKSLVSLALQELPKLPLASLPPRQAAHFC